LFEPQRGDTTDGGVFTLFEPQRGDMTDGGVFTLFEPQRGDTTDGCVSLLHEAMEIEQELLFFGADLSVVKLQTIP
jgi:hypothetical protein